MIAVASDHAGYPLKQHIIGYLEEMGYRYKDFGCNGERSDYPVYAERAAKAVASGECCCGLLFCGTGIGISIAANKIKGIRCACCSDAYSAEFSRLHNDVNMLALGSRVVGTGLAVKLVELFLTTEFEGGRHKDRVDLIMELDAGKEI
ncbi:MAG: ribose 5-phosphate isomerase B [Clostridiales bacterium]|nr:ribose 5-phosphate isomerase B [Clostridiales bacterium]